MLLSDDAIQEAANLISRGVRPLALVGTVSLEGNADTDHWNLMTAYSKIEYLNVGRANGHEIIPVVVLRKDKSCADVGITSRAWVAETFKWVLDNAQQPQLNHLLGLLLGYSPDAIAASDESEAGRLFPYGASGIPELESIPPHRQHRKEENDSPLQEESPSCAHTGIDSLLTPDKPLRF